MTGTAGSRIADLLIDVGGTNTRIALLDGAEIKTAQRWKTSDHAALRDLLAHYARLSGCDAFGNVFVGVAGPVKDGNAKLTNASFVVNGPALSAAFPGARFHILNDLEAMAYSLRSFSDLQIEYVHQAEESAERTRVVIAPGTGLGVAVYCVKNSLEAVLETECGHMCAAPVFAEHMELFGYLFGEKTYVSVESLVSGPGLVTLYDAFCALAPAGARPESSQRKTSPEEIISAATNGACALSSKSIEMFSSLLGSFCGDLALAFSARGGVFLAGNLAMAMSDYLKAPAFLDAYVHKGAMSQLVRRTPLGVINEKEPVLAGLRQYALMKRAEK